MLKRTGLLISLTLAALALLVSGCDETSAGADAGAGTDAGAPGSDAAAPTNTIADIATSSGDFSMLVSAADRAGLVGALTAPGPITVFAPTNQAFMDSGITQDALDTMPIADLTGILTYHVLDGSVPASAVTDGPATTLASLTLFLDTADGVAINGGNTVTGGANVVGDEIVADNGIVHVIDRVLLPPSVAGLAVYGGLSELVTAVGAASDLPGDVAVIDALSDPDAEYTVFAPTNEAFSTLLGSLPGDPTADQLRDILLYHLLDSEVASSAIPALANTMLANPWGNGVSVLFDTTDGATINGVDIVITDLRGTNGIVHVIDTVLLPPSIVDMAGIAGLSSLATAIGSASDIPPSTPVADALQGDGPLTVFAPTNDAFAAAAGVTAGLSADQLRDVLLFHVVAGAAPVLSTDLSSGEVETLYVDSVTIDVDGAAPTVEGADVVIADVNTTNGVVHVIGAVMVPPSL